jgi:hypothetical protein
VAGDLTQRHRCYTWLVGQWTIDDSQWHVQKELSDRLRLALRNTTVLADEHPRNARVLDMPPLQAIDHLGRYDHDAVIFGPTTHDWNHFVWVDTVRKYRTLVRPGGLLCGVHCDRKALIAWVEEIRHLNHLTVDAATWKLEVPA